MIKSRNESHHEVVELEVKEVGGVGVKINHCAKNKIISHSKLSSISTTDPGCLTPSRQNTATTENLKLKL